MVCRLASFGASLGFVLSIPAWHLAALITLVLYGAIYALVDNHLIRLRNPTLTWQVPAAWLHGRPMWKKTIIWGWWLGPGIFTRNPFPGMWTLPLWLASLHGGSAVLAGALSGLAPRWDPRRSAAL